MKELVAIPLLLLLGSCGQKTNSNSPFGKSKISGESQASNQTEAKPPAPEEKWFDPEKLDTTMVFPNGIKFILKPAQELDIEEYYIDQQALDSISARHTNSHLLALDIEKHKLKDNRDFVKRDSSDLWLKPFNGRWQLMTLNPNNEEADNTFEHHFQEWGYYSIRVQWGEGNGYKIFSRSNGQVTEMFGRPYFSENGEYVLSVNNDIEAGYSDNGFQLFRNCYGDLKLLATYKTDVWGPYSAKWTGENRLVLKSQALSYHQAQEGYIDFYTEVEFDEFWE